VLTPRSALRRIGKKVQAMLDYEEEEVDPDDADWRLHLAPGDEVTWNDPDCGECSRTDIIGSIEYSEDGSRARIVWKNGDELECFTDELSYEQTQMVPKRLKQRACFDGTSLELSMENFPALCAILRRFPPHGYFLREHVYQRLFYNDVKDLLTLDLACWTKDALELTEEGRQAAKEVRELKGDQR
jgi:hypothetical protein